MARQVSAALPLKAFRYLWPPEYIPDLALWKIVSLFNTKQHAMVSIVYRHFRAKEFSGYDDFAFNVLNTEEILHDEDLNKIFESFRKVFDQRWLIDLYESWRYIVDTCLEAIGNHDGIFRAYQMISEAPPDKNEIERLSEFCLACHKDESDFADAMFCHWLLQRGVKDVEQSSILLVGIMIRDISTVVALEDALHHATVAVIGLKAQEDIKWNIPSKFGWHIIRQALAALSKCADEVFDKAFIKCADELSDKAIRLNSLLLDLIHIADCKIHPLKEGRIEEVEVIEEGEIEEVEAIEVVIHGAPMIVTLQRAKCSQLEALNPPV